jgi:phosphoadenosine phosphosulfate reductase
MAQSIAQTALDIPSLNEELSSLSPQKIVARALSMYDNIAISFSGAEDVVLIDIAHRLKKDIQVFSLDTGRLHPETYQFIDRVRKHYGIAIDVLSPDAAQVEALVKAKGLFSFYEDGHKEWWEDATKKECGLHAVNPIQSA